MEEAVPIANNALDYDFLIDATEIYKNCTLLLGVPSGSGRGVSRYRTCILVSVRLVWQVLEGSVGTLLERA